MSGESSRYLAQAEREWQEWLRKNTAVAAEFHHQTYPSPHWINSDPRTWNEMMAEQERQRWRCFWCLL